MAPGAASMGPSMSIDGVDAGLRRPAAGPRRFNGAVDEHRRSPLRLAEATGEGYVLQWGRR